MLPETIKEAEKYLNATAKKERKCCRCKGKIAIGSRYWTRNTAPHGSRWAETTRYCLQCAAAYVLDASEGGALGMTIKARR